MLSAIETGSLSAAAAELMVLSLRREAVVCWHISSSNFATPASIPESRWFVKSAQKAVCMIISVPKMPEQWKKEQQTVTKKQN